MMQPVTRSSLILLFSILGVAPILAQAEQPKPQPATKGLGVTLPFSACIASPTWLSPSNQPPTEIGNGVPVASETNCQFYQFSYQWFLSLMQPAASGSGERAFEALNLYLPNLKNQCSKPKLSAVKNRANIGKALFIRTLKTDSGTFDPVLPEEITQATGEALYDQAGNVVLYNVWYNNTECQATSQGFQPNTVEIKTSWRILATADPSYYTITATVPAISKQPLNLGLVGIHLVINTANHPEFVWATFEHKSNAPDCTHPQSTPSEGWSFTSASCAACLVNQTPQQCAAAQPQCSFNTGVKPQGVKGTPNEACRVYSDGTDPGSMTNGNNNDTNRANIDMLNAQLVGPAGMITQLPTSNPLAVLKNYFLVGGLWTNGGVSSTAPNAQRGSLELSNMTMETFFQDQGNNCFTCHGYDPSAPLDVSHIINNLIPTGSSKAK
ncbi:hypothetical protein [Methylovulum miyakonense]|uniref:hypothetical protein n=1 Tax=Methylovulum miyakonense TaxID=645578 RepID=UPI0003623C8F|nr:hypothetical protein [Methylovulum miyakonense]